MGTEKLKFKIELYATMWDKPPHAEVSINDKSHFTGVIDGTEDKPSVIEFEHELLEKNSHCLSIRRSGKSQYPEPWATQQRKDGVELRKSFNNVTQMGHNGEWKFTFSSPFYMWLLENLY